MKLLFFIVLVIFLQSSFVPFNLTLVLLLSYFLVSETHQTYYYSFGSGVGLGLISSINLGFYPLEFLIFNKLTQLIKGSQFSAHILPLSLYAGGVFALDGWLQMTLLAQDFYWWYLLIELAIFLPTYWIMNYFASLTSAHSVRLKLHGK